MWQLFHVSATVAIFAFVFVVGRTGRGDEYADEYTTTEEKTQRPQPIREFGECAKVYGPHHHGERAPPQFPGLAGVEFRRKRRADPGDGFDLDGADVRRQRHCRNGGDDPWLVDLFCADPSVDLATRRRPHGRSPPRQICTTGICCGKGRTDGAIDATKSTFCEAPAGDWRAFVARHLPLVEIDSTQLYNDFNSNTKSDRDVEPATEMNM